MMTFAIFLMLFFSSSSHRSRLLLECLEDVFILLFNEWKLWKSSSEFFISSPLQRDTSECQWSPQSEPYFKSRLGYASVINWKYLIRMESFLKGDKINTRRFISTVATVGWNCHAVNNWNQQNITSHQLRHFSFFNFTEASKRNRFIHRTRLQIHIRCRDDGVYFWRIRSEKFIWIIFHLINACLAVFSVVCPRQLWWWSSVWARFLQKSCFFSSHLDETCARLSLYQILVALFPL